MTQIALHAPVYAAAAAAVAGRAFALLGKVFDGISAAAQARVEIERLGRLTNSELAAQGLNRETALRDVFDRCFR